MSAKNPSVQRPQRKWRKLKLVLKITGVVVVLLIVAYLLACLVLGHIADRKIEAALTRAREAGEPLTVEELFPPVPSEQNALHVYEECFAILHQMPEERRHEDEMRLSPDPMDYELLEGALTNWRRLYPLIEKAAALPHLRFDFERALTAFGDDRLLEELADLRSLGRYLRAKALLSAHREDVEQAFNSCLLSYSLASHLEQRPLLMTLLSAFSPQYISSGTIVEILQQQTSIAEHVLVELLDQLPSFDYSGAFTRALFAERLFALRLLEAERGWGALGLRIVCAPSIEAYEEVIALSRKPYYEVLTSEAESELLHSYSGFFAPLARMAIESCTNVRGQVARAEASYEGLKLVLALRIHKLRTGSYPDSLAPLKEILGELPKDPFTGKSFVYERVGEGFRILIVARELRKGNDPKDDRKEKHRYWQLDQ